MAIPDLIAPPGEGPVELPAAAGDLTAPRFEPDEAWLREADLALQKAALWRWFATHFEDPRQAVPHDDAGNFLYGDDEPVQADQALQQRFGGQVDDAVLKAVHDALCAEVGNDWAHRRLDKAGA